MPGLTMKYFVLNPASKNKNDIYAKASRIAMIAYAETIMVENPELSAELLAWVETEKNKKLCKDLPKGR